MRKRLRTSRDNLDVENLPDTSRTELNYRTRPTTSKQERAMMLRRLGWGIVVLPPMLFLLRILTTWIGQYIALAALIVAVWCVSLQLFRFLMCTPTGKLPVASTAAFAVAVIAGLWNEAISPTQAFLALVLPTLWFTFFWAETVARNVAHWMTVNMRVEWETTQRWREYFEAWREKETANECPEVLSVRVFRRVFVVTAVLILFAVWRFGPIDRTARVVVYAMPALFALPTLLWFAWNSLSVTPRVPFWTTLRVTWAALTVWLTYNRHQTRAAGVFQFPSWYRSPYIRDALTGCVCLAWGIASLPLLTAATLSPTENYFRVTWIWLSPVLMTMGILWCVFGTLLTRFWLALESPDAYDVSLSASEWDIAVERILQSADEMERNHLLLGTSLVGDYPVLLHRDLLDQHAQITGGTGANKTSLGIAPLLTQLIAAKNCSVVVVDLKGDRALFQSASIEAERSKAKFKWFTNLPECPSYVFNPLAQSHFQKLNDTQKTQTVIEALGLNYGSSYGRGFYGSQNETVLQKYFEAYSIKSFQQLAKLLNDKSSFLKLGEESEWRNARHLAALVGRLANSESLNLTSNTSITEPEAWANRIDVGDLLAQPEVAYFYLASPREPQGAASVAKLLLQSLFTAAMLQLGQPKQQVYLFIDEFQMVISENIKLVLAQARSMGLSIIIAHQTSGQLKSEGVNLASTIESCVGFTQRFRVTEPDEVRRVVETSGLGLFHTLTWRQAADTRMNDGSVEDIYDLNKAYDGVVEVSETEGPLLDRNTVMELSSRPNTSIVSFCAGSGYTQFRGYPTPIKTQFHISAEEYARRLHAPWPEHNIETLVNHNSYSPDQILLPTLGTKRIPPSEWDSRFDRLADSTDQP